MNKNFLLLALAALVMTACGANSVEPPLPDGPYDWCYTFDFTESDYDAVVAPGSWIDGVGFRTSADEDPNNPQGELYIRYVHSQFVEVASISVFLEFYHNAFLPFGENSHISGIAHVFGIDSNFSADVLTSISEQEVEFRPESPGIAGTLAELYLDSTAQVTMTHMVVSGYGSNPFPSNGCSDPTQTPTPFIFPSATASSTFTPSPTPTSTATLTNTPITPTTTPCPDLNLTVNQTPSANVTVDANALDNTQYPSGFLTYENTEGFEYTFQAAAQISAIYGSFGRFSANDGVRVLLNAGQIATSDIAGVPTNGSAGSTTVSFSPVWVYPGDILRVERYEVGTPATTLLMQIVNVDRTSCETPPDATATPTPDAPATATAEGNATATEHAILTATSNYHGTATAAASITPTTTPTPSVSDQCGFANYTFEQGLSGWTTSGTAAPAVGAVVLEDGAFVGQSLALAAGEYVLSWVSAVDDPGTATTDGGISWTYYVGEDDETTSGRAESNYYQLGNQISSGVTVVIATDDEYELKVGPNLTSVNSMKILSMCLSIVSPDLMPDDNPGNDNDSAAGAGGWQTCGDQISQPSSLLDIGGWISFLWESLMQTIQCVIMPPIWWLGALLDALIRFVLFSLIPFILLTIGNFFAALINGVQSGIGGLIESINSQITFVGDVANSIGVIITNWGQTASAYMGAAQSQMMGIITTFNTAPSAPPPGLPDCIAAPMEYEICAVFWVLENTIFYGTIGQLLVPAVTVFVDLLILFYFGNMIKRFIVEVWEMLK